MYNLTDIKAPKGKRLKATAKVPKLGKKKLHAQGLDTLSEIALSEAEQMKITTKRSKTQFHSSHASRSGAHEGTGVSLWVPDVSDDEQISWKSSDDEDDDDADNQGDDDEDDDDADNQGDDDQDDADQDDDNEQTKSDNDDDIFVHPKFSTFDQEERHEEKLYEEEEGSDQRIHTPLHFESTDDEAYDEVTQGDNGRDTEMTDALLTNVQATQVVEDTHVIMTVATPKAQQQSSSVSSGFIPNMLNPNSNTCIDSILNLNNESTSLVDVPVTTNIEMPPSSITTLPPPPIPLVHPQQQTPVLTPTIILIILDTYGDAVTFKRRRDDKDDDEEPSTGSNRGSKRRRAGKEPKTSSASTEKTSKSYGKSKEGLKSHQKSTGKSGQAEEPIHTFEDLEEPAP
nr:hypothetical protein [Tanacetum cinerariifolium]